MPFSMKTYYYMIHPQVLDIWNTGTEYRARAVKHNPFTCCSHLLVNISFLFSNRFSYLSSKNKAKRRPLHPASPNNNRTQAFLQKLPPLQRAWWRRQLLRHRSLDSATFFRFRLATTWSKSCPTYATWSTRPRRKLSSRLSDRYSFGNNYLCCSPAFKFSNFFDLWSNVGAVGYFYLPKLLIDNY